MSDLNYRAVKCGTSRYKQDISFSIIYTSLQKFSQRKNSARCAEYYYKGSTDLLAVLA